jgi:hypothetical protein
MVPAPLLLFNDAPWLLAGGRVNPLSVRCVHPLLARATCERLGVSTVSAQVEERLAKGFAPAPLKASGAAGGGSGGVSEQMLLEPPRLTALLNSPELAAALARIVDHYGGKPAADGPSRAAGVRAALAGVEVVFVGDLTTEFVRCHRGGSEEDVTARPGGDRGSLHFMDLQAGGTRRVLVARLALPPSIAPAFLVARAVAHSVLPNHLLGMSGSSSSSSGSGGGSSGESGSSGGSSGGGGSLRDALVAPLAAVLGCGGPAEVSGVLRLLQLEEDARACEERRRGLPGERLLDEDRK